MKRTQRQRKEAYKKQLLNQLSDYNSFEGTSNAEAAMPTNTSELDAELNQAVGNPPFKATFTIQVRNTYYDVTGGTPIAPAAIPSVLQVSNPFFVFGQSDLASAYARGRQLVPFVQGGAGFWNFTLVAIFGVTYLDPAVVPAAAVSDATTGDILFISSATVLGNDFLRICRVSCPQVAYNTLVDSLSSDRFVLNMIRYVVPTTNTTQLTNQIFILKQTIFGKTVVDTVDPQTFIGGQTFNDNIADIRLTLGVDKNAILGTQVNFDVETIEWTTTVYKTNKVVQNLYGS